MKLFDYLHTELGCLPLETELQEIRDIVLEEEGLKWIPVSERLPDKEGKYIVTDKYNDVVVSELYSSGRWVDNVEGYYEVLPSAWMPLPEPYKPKP